MTDQSGGVRALRLAEQRGTLCDQCAEQHRATIEFAATIIDIELAGRRRSQAAADLRAMLPPNNPHTTHNPGAAT